jgi:hypothetical protein
MKRIQLLTVGMMLLNMGITSCKKSSYDVTPTAATTQSSGARFIENNAKVTFTTGYLNTSFISVRSNEQMLFQSRELHNWNLFDPLQQIGMKLPLESYKGLATTVEAGPHDGLGTMYLLGVLSSSDAAGNVHPGIPVTFLMNKPVGLFATSELMTIDEKSNVLNLLNLNTDRLTANITPDMWKNAVDYLQGTITISETQNADLYRIILENMGTMLRVQIGIPDPTLPTDNVVRAPRPEMSIP